MTEPAWGPSFDGIRFGIEPVAPGAPLHVPLHVENHGRTAVRVFGFTTSYPRSLRISPGATFPTCSRSVTAACSSSASAA